MTEEELLKAFFASKDALMIYCPTLEARHRALDLLLPYAPDKNLNYVADDYPPHQWPILGWDEKQLVLCSFLSGSAITIQELEVIMGEETAEELVFGSELEALL